MSDALSPSQTSRNKRVECPLCGSHVIIPAGAHGAECSVCGEIVSRVLSEVTQRWAG